MSDTDYGLYYNHEVSLILDGRGLDTQYYAFENSISLAMTATPTGETDTILNLENITILNGDPLKGKFAAGSVNKDYIIGIFVKEMGNNDIN